MNFPVGFAPRPDHRPTPRGVEPAGPGRCRDVAVPGGRCSAADITAVTFGPGRSATGLSCTATSCTVTAPAGTSMSKVPVQAVNAAGTSPATGTTVYTYGR